MSDYKLCYIKGRKAWFTDNFEKQWGDDWGDSSYEHNTDQPYDHWYDEDGKEHAIGLKTLYFETNDWSARQPCDSFLNSPYSVENINKGAVAWLCTDKYNIAAGTTMEEFIDIVEKNGGDIYMKRSDINAI